MKVRPTPKGRRVDPQALQEVRSLLGGAPRRRDLLIEHLHRIQDRHGSLPAAHLAALAEEMKLSLVLVDTSGKLTGRGAYLHDRRSCWEQGLKGSLSRALQVDLTHENREHLLTYMESLPEAPEDDSGENSM